MQPALVTATLAPHALPQEELLRALQSSRQGLSRQEAATRLQRFGPNALPRARPPQPWQIFLRQFKSPLIYVLLVAAGISVVLGHFSDAVFISAVLLLNAVIGTVQEYGAERSAEALRSMVALQARVVRDAEDLEVNAEDLVPGDVVLLEAGGKVPADIRLLWGTGPEIDESLLTGESLPVAKDPAVVIPEDAPVADRVNMAFAGTLVTDGRGYGIVVATGQQTQLGGLATAVVRTPPAKPPLLVRMDRFARRIAIAIVLAASIVAAGEAARGTPAAQIFLGAIALAVSAIPEGLPVALTVALALGARRMARRNVIARRLVAIEALGSCTFIASDKTGTLTLNQLTVRRLDFPGGAYAEVTGEGTVPTGQVQPPEGSAWGPLQPLVERACRAAALCNDGFLGRRDGQWVHHGDTVDVALLVMAHKAGLEQGALATACPRLGVIPYEPARQYAATLNQCDGGRIAFVKGAAERVLSMCEQMATSHGDIPIDRQALLAQMSAQGALGYRVLAVASGPVDVPPGHEFSAEALHGLVFLGFIALIDPLRPEARSSIEACARAGIAVAMVTGDHPSTALAIARELGIARSQEEVVTGHDLSAAAGQGNATFDALVKEMRVFARVEPRQKLQIVESLVRLGHFVAVTGDGANDAPALRAAHIGVAMGQRGADIARETSDLVLADDNFASVVAAVEEGRVTYANVRKVVLLLISTGAAEVLLFFMASAAGLPLPLLPAQLLWLNLVTNGIQDVALAFESKEGGEMDRPPRRPNEPLLDRAMLQWTLLSAAVMSGVTFGAYKWMLDAGWELDEARNGALLLLVLFENVHAMNCRSETISLARLSPARNVFLVCGTIAAQVLHIGAMYTPGLKGALHIEPVSLAQWAILLGLASTLLVVIEAEKLRRRRLRSRISRSRLPGRMTPSRLP